MNITLSFIALFSSFNRCYLWYIKSNVNLWFRGFTVRKFGNNKISRNTHEKHLFTKNNFFVVQHIPLHITKHTFLDGTVCGHVPLQVIRCKHKHTLPGSSVPRFITNTLT
ncbi:hypothetical protein VCUG_00463 [Vavraia culicis subsp. floridensis]|uniref:Uncharacterized protein n=1 Tax=Vavraia culicis (isolate floridensis) TaxID=948595 RepID=L2GY72_VAVCU|nr:uncharacterized protein VCUG_00463 [Vavraia culicis subsp. floridensis]ELA48040.1 hypothetical protein VCUG_00463 [Vavraia culicis subsp. floridensis]